MKQVYNAKGVQFTLKQSYQLTFRSLEGKNK